MVQSAMHQQNLGANFLFGFTARIACRAPRLSSPFQNEIFLYLAGIAVLAREDDDLRAKLTIILIESLARNVVEIE